MRNLIRWAKNNNVEYIKSGDKITLLLGNIYTVEVIKGKNKYYMKKLKYGNEVAQADFSTWGYVEDILNSTLKKAENILRSFFKIIVDIKYIS